MPPCPTAGVGKELVAFYDCDTIIERFRDGRGPWAIGASRLQGFLAVHEAIMARRLFLLALAVASVFAIAGCRSGQVSTWLQSDDGRVLLFHDEDENTFYVADESGVRRLGKFYGDGMALSPDGRQALLIGSSVEPEARLFSLVEGSTLQADQPVLDYAWRPKFWFHTRESGHPPRPGKVDWPRAETIRVWFHEDGVTFSMPAAAGPVRDESGKLDFSQTPRVLTCWSPDGQWRKLDTPPPGDPLQVADLRNGYAGVGDDPSPLVYFPPSRGHARRTLWVRPDGTVVTLLQQDNVAPRVLGEIISLPQVLFVAIFEPIVLTGRSAAKDLEPDPLLHDRAAVRLERLVADRKGHGGTARPPGRRRPL